MTLTVLTKITLPGVHCCQTVWSGLLLGRTVRYVTIHVQLLMFGSDRVNSNSLNTYTHLSRYVVLSLAKKYLSFTQSTK